MKLEIIIVINVFLFYVNVLIFLMLTIINAILLRNNF